MAPFRFAETVAEFLGWGVERSAWTPKQRAVIAGCIVNARREWRAERRIVAGWGFLRPLLAQSGSASRAGG